MANPEIDKIIRSYTRGEEKVHAAFPAYVRMGTKKILMGVTDTRVIAVKTPYGSVKDGGLLWADPIEDVALRAIARELYVGTANTGNTYLQLRRADGSTLRFNPRESFVGNTPSATNNVARLYELIPGRF